MLGWHGLFSEMSGGNGVKNEGQLGYLLHVFFGNLGGNTVHGFFSEMFSERSGGNFKCWVVFKMTLTSFLIK